MPHHPSLPSSSPPPAVAVIGSFLVQLQARPITHVDVAVEMPPAVIEAKDHLNHRYLHKRAYYLGVLADALLADKNFKDVRFESFEGNPLKPILACRSQKGKMQLRIFPSVAPDTFKVCGPQHLWAWQSCTATSSNRLNPVFLCITHNQLSKLAPSRNNVRRAKNAELLPGAKKDVLEGT
jgi:hypothetical protein